MNFYSLLQNELHFYFCKNENLRLVEKFNLHINLKTHVDFVKKFVELFDLLVEYRDLKDESSEELKTFYLNEILVKK